MRIGDLREFNIEKPKFPHYTLEVDLGGLTQMKSLIYHFVANFPNILGRF